MLVCSNVVARRRRRRRPRRRAAARLAERAAARGLRIAYEALAWGRHVDEYDHAWRIVERAAHPALGHVPGQLPHPLPRHDLDDDRRDPGREALLPPARRRAAPRHGRPAVEPALPLLPGPGRLRPRRLRHARPRHRLRRPAVARGLQRRLPPRRSRADGGRRDALAADPRRRRSRRATRRGGCRRRRGSTATPSSSSRSSPRRSARRSACCTPSAARRARSTARSR